MKINRGFSSFLDLMFGKMEAINYNPTNQSQLLGGLQPLVDIGKDLINTFKPYKSFSYFIEDLKQPLRGVGNMLKGIGYIAVTPLTLFSEKPVQTALSWLNYGVLNILKGGLQVVTTPLTYFLRAPLRGLISCFSGKPERFEDKESVKSLLAQAKGSSVDICYELHRKFNHTVEMNLPTNKDKRREAQLFKEAQLIDAPQYGNGGYAYPPSEEAVRNYLNFFKPAQEQAEVVNSLSFSHG